jgi:hypothetical protein
MRKQLIYIAIAVLLLVMGFGVARTIVKGKRLTRASVGTNGNVAADPHALALKASEATGDFVSDEEYALCRMIGSEEPDADYATQVAIAWVCVNDSQSFGSVLDVVTYSTDSSRRGYFGDQTHRRYSTARDPYEGHLQVARAVLSGLEADTTGGAVNFFRPLVQNLLHGQNPTRYKSADQVDAEWSRSKERVVVAGADQDLWFYRKVG